jgi:hypothetical protein
MGNGSSQRCLSLKSGEMIKRFGSGLRSNTTLSRSVRQVRRAWHVERAIRSGLRRALYPDKPDPTHPVKPMEIPEKSVCAASVANSDAQGSPGTGFRRTLRRNVMRYFRSSAFRVNQKSCPMMARDSCLGGQCATHQRIPAACRPSGCIRYATYGRGRS